MAATDPNGRPGLRVADRHFRRPDSAPFGSHEPVLSRSLTEFIELFGRSFRWVSAMKQFSGMTKPFPACRADVRKQRLVISSNNKNGGQRRQANPETVK